MGKILVVSTHLDDETLGCGGTLLKHKQNDHTLYWLIMTDISEEIGYSHSDILERKKLIGAISQSYGMKEVFNLNFPTTMMDKIPLSNIINEVAFILKKIEPNIIYIPNRSDIHSDHRVTFDAVISCTKSFRFPSVKKVLMYETISETEFAPPLYENAFQPNAYCDISQHLEDKINILNLYKKELGTHPFPRSIDNVIALATFRGAIAGVKYAEAFMVLKELF